MVEIFNNIRQLYRFTLPCEALLEHIEFFSETSLDDTNNIILKENFTVTLFPSYTPTIWINLGSPYYLQNGNRMHLVDSDTDVLVLRDKVIKRNNLPTDNIYTVKFNPGGLEAILGISQANIANGLINVSNIIPPDTMLRLKAMDNFEERTLLLETFFLSKIKARYHEKYTIKIVKEAIDAFSSSSLSANNSTVAENLFLTDKTLYRYFNTVIGTSPKSYFATMRARSALTAYVKDPLLFTPYNYGYYDRSHFYKDVLKFTGQKLSSF